MAFIWYANCSIHFTGQEAKEKMSLRVDDKPNLFIILFNNFGYVERNDSHPRQGFSYSVDAENDIGKREVHCPRCRFS